MPLVDSADPTSQVYWTTTDILNFARVLVNDTQGTLSGQNLADNAPATWPLLNFCYAKLQNALEDSNVESVTYADAIVTVPGSGSYSDPASQSVLSYSGFTDAAGNTYDEPTLPPDLTMPLSLETRTAGQNAPFLPMAQRQGGLPSQFGNYRFLMWEFKQGGIYLLGGPSVPQDIHIRYIPSLPVLVPQQDGTAQEIPLARAGLALAYMIAAEYQEIRGAANAPMMRAKADNEVTVLANKSAKRSNISSQRSRGYGFNRKRGGGFFGVYG